MSWVLLPPTELLPPPALLRLRLLQLRLLPPPLPPLRPVRPPAAATGGDLCSACTAALLLSC